MTKKLTWEVDKTSLVLRITDGDRETKWVVRKNTTTEKLRGFLSEMLLELQESPENEYGDWARIASNTPMIENVRTVDAEELAELRRYNRYETTEEASRAAQAAAVRQLEVGAKWFDVEDDVYEGYIPDYDSGEVRPR